MKNIAIIRLSVLTSIFTFCLPCAAFEKVDSARSEIVIEGKVSEPELATTPEKVFQLIFYISELPFNKVDSRSIPYILNLKYNEHFLLKVPHKNKRLYIAYDCNAGGTWSFIDRIYIFDQGDKVKMDIQKDKITFYGTNSARKQCQDDLFRIQYVASNDTPIIQQFYDEKKWKEDLALRAQREDSILRARLNVIDSYRQKIGEEHANLLTASCYAMRYYLLFRESTFAYPAEKFEDFRKSDDFVNSDKRLTGLSDDVLSEVPIYADFIRYKIAIEYMDITNGVLKKSSGIDRQFEYITNNYKGELRDALLSNWVFTYRSHNVIMEKLDEVVGLVKATSYQEALKEFQATRMIGKPFFPFNLPGENGKLVSLNNFKGKVVFLDMWYTGCGPCAKLNKHLDPLYTRYKDNSKVKFVTIAYDPIEELWKKSLASGMYTHPGSVNLWLKKDAAARNQPQLLAHYNITGFPTAFIIQDGKMFDATPPLGDLNKLYEQMDKALAGMN